MDDSKAKSGNSLKSWLLWGIPALFAIASPMHFLFGWLNKTVAAGIFAPVNESVWEHLKMAFWPMLLWWIAGYLIFHKSAEIKASLWFLSCTVSEVVCQLFIISFFYTYTGAFGFESLVLDILSLFLGIAAGQCLAWHIYKNKKAGRIALILSVAVLVILTAAFTLFTFNPPHIPIFMDFSAGVYGI